MGRGPFRQGGECEAALSESELWSIQLSINGCWQADILGNAGIGTQDLLHACSTAQQQPLSKERQGFYASLGYETACRVLTTGTVINQHKIPFVITRVEAVRETVVCHFARDAVCICVHPAHSRHTAASERL